MMADSITENASRSYVQKHTTNFLSELQKSTAPPAKEENRHPKFSELWLKFRLFVGCDCHGAHSSSTRQLLAQQSQC
jgi:hypothetical protein